MEKPSSLNKGDKIVIVSTARKISKQEVNPAVEELKKWGLEVVFGDNLFGEFHQFSGTVEQRLEDFQKALNDNSVKAILCARGGYGTVQIIDRLDFSLFKEKPKWIIGYSDVTVLHNHINENLNIQTLHATMPINFATNTIKAKDSLKKALFGENLFYKFKNHPLNTSGKAKGQIVGGNLSIIYSLTGTNSQLTTAGKILFLEDLDEYLYHIDRMMMNLDRAGMLENLAGLVVGGMTEMNDNTIPYGETAKQIISNIVSKYNYPVCFNFPSGHLDDNRSIIMGADIELVVDDECSVNMSTTPEPHENL